MGKSPSNILQLFLKRWNNFFRGRLVYTNGKKIFYCEHRNEAIFLTIHQTMATNVMSDIGASENEQITILDIGANSGQFAFAVKELFENCTILSFEPNSSPRMLLTKNAKQWDGWHVYPFGLSNRTETLELFYVPGKSGQGSLHKGNATLDLLGRHKDKVKSEIVNLLGPEDLSKLIRGYHMFTLVKIDVEGFEKNVLECLIDINFKYLLIELSESRLGGVNLTWILNQLKQVDKVGKVIQIYGNSDSKIKDVLLHIEKSGA